MDEITFAVLLLKVRSSVCFKILSCFDLHSTHFSNLFLLEATFHSKACSIATNYQPLNGKIRKLEISRDVKNLEFTSDCSAKTFTFVFIVTYV